MNLYTFKYQFYNKTMRVINSCKTIEHLKYTKDWINIILKRVFNSSLKLMEVNVGYQTIAWIPKPPSPMRSTEFTVRKSIDPMDDDVVLIQIRNILRENLIRKYKEIRK